MYQLEEKSQKMDFLRDAWDCVFHVQISKQNMWVLYIIHRLSGSHSKSFYVILIGCPRMNVLGHLHTEILIKVDLLSSRSESFGSAK